MLDNIRVLYHSSILINDNIYIDPYNIQEEKHNANLIFITHSHYDHFSPKDIEKIYCDSTKIICPLDVKKELLHLGYSEDNILGITPNLNCDISGINFKTIPAYNIIKPFHPKFNNWVGYILNINNIKIYIAGDTDITQEAKSVTCDVALVPIGGTYTMNYKEAAKLANTINPQYVIPTHYNSIIGKKEDADKFIQLLNKEIKYRLDLY